MGSYDDGSARFGGFDEFAGEAVALSGFTAPPDVDQARAEELRRRFSTVLIDPFDIPQVGGSGMVVPAYDGQGKVVALKRLVLPTRSEGQSAEDYERVCQRRLRAFRDEFDLLARLAGFSQFPEVYGYGEVDGTPAILMEWVDGFSLEEFLSVDAGDGRNHYSAPEVAVIGKSLFRVLSILEAFGEGFVHRDLSPANIIVRVSKGSVKEQVERGELDLCLIDFGSSVIDLDALGAIGAAADATASALRGTTPEYAPPEMLTDEMPDVAELRNSPKVDVYAACSVLHELLWGETPFQIQENAPSDLAGFKTAEAPRPDPELTVYSSLALSFVLSRGLAASQEDRPAADVMLRACERFLEVGDWLSKFVKSDGEIAEGLREGGDKLVEAWDLSEGFFEEDGWIAHFENGDLYPGPVDPLLFFPPGSVPADRPVSDDDLNKAIGDMLEFGGDYGKRGDGVPETGERGRFGWWLQRHFAGSMTVMAVVYTLLILYLGHAWHVHLA